METVIRLREDSIIIEEERENGMKAVKHTNLETLQNILTADVHIETPLLPGQWGVQKYLRKDDLEGYVITVPEMVREVKFDFRQNGVDETRAYTIPVPASVWFFTVRYNPADNTRQLVQSMAYAIKNPILSENDPVFHLPVANISGGICWGSGRSTPEIGSAKSIQSIPTQFFLRPFNNDLSDNKFESFNDEREGREDVRLFRVQHLFDFLDYKLKQDEGYTFPYDVLRGDGTFDQRMRRFFSEIMG